MGQKNHTGMYIGLAFAAVAAQVQAYAFNQNNKPSPEISYTQLRTGLGQKSIASLTINGQIINGTYKNKTPFKSILPLSFTSRDVDAMTADSNADVKYVAKRSFPEELAVNGQAILFVSILPLLSGFGSAAAYNRLTRKKEEEPEPEEKAEPYVRPKEEEKLIAYHEAAHALACIFHPDLGYLEGITIESEEGEKAAGSATLKSKEGILTKQNLKSEIIITLAGRAAEELVLGNDQISAGSYPDLERVKKIASDMVIHYGMSDAFGPVVFGQEKVSAAKQVEIEQEIESIIKNAYQETTQFLTEHREQLDLLAATLLERRTLTAAQVYDLLGLENPHPIPEAETAEPVM